MRAGGYCSQILATPVLRAASATALATASPTLGSKAAGMMYSSFSSSSEIRLASAMAAAIFISSLMSDARTSKVPRKMPGNARTLLIWLGKSLRPVEMTFAPPAFASSVATNLSQEVNGVSKIHGRVSREMFQQMWPGYFAEENHIGYVTNGVHLPTWTDFSWQRLYREVLGKDYVDVQSDTKVWEKINNVADETVWNIKKDLKRRLTEYLKVKVVEDMQRRQESPSLIINTIENFNENALIIGFARRFATYKRAHLLFNNIERLAELLNNPEKPVVFLFAGKAHPNDKAGQYLIKMII